MAFGIDGTIVVTFLTGAFSVIMGGLNFLFTWICRHIVLLVGTAFLISWFLTWYLIKLILSTISHFYDLNVSSGDISISTFFSKIFEGMQVGQYSFAHWAFKIFDVLNLPFLCNIIESLVIPAFGAVFVAKFMMFISSKLSTR